MGLDSSTDLGLTGLEVCHGAFEDAADLVGGEAELLGAVDRGGEGLGEFVFAFGDAAGDGGLAHPHALAADPLDEAFDLEARVRLADGHGVDFGGLRDLADAGEQVAGFELPARNESADLVDELAVDGDARGGMELEEVGGERHGVSV